MAQVSGAESLVQSLVAHGVDTVFGLPGVQIMPIFDALHGHPEIRVVNVRHEQAAAYMADGYARASGKPGVALVVPGPGALNAAGALGTAYSASSPVLLISGQIGTGDLGRRRGVLHEVDDQLEVFRPLTKWRHRVMEADGIPGAVHRAFQELCTGRPRPVELELPPDVLTASAPEGDEGPDAYAPPAPTPEAVADAAQLLSNARRVLIWAGGGAVRSHAGEELAAVAGLLGAPVITTPEGKGAIPEDHPLSIGACFSSFGPARWLAPQADVVLAVGTRFTLPMTGPWSLRPPQALVQIDIDPEEVGQSYPAQVGLVGDARLTLGALRECLEGAQRSSSWTQEDFQAARLQAEQEVHELTSFQLPILNALRQEMDRDAVLVSGVTNVAYWANLAYPVYEPDTYLTSSYFATLGFAFPTALGAKVARPERQVVALTGDGGFLYDVGELATAVQHGINIVVVVFNDNAFGASLNDQQTRYEGRVIGTQLHNPDFVKLAESFGAVGMRAQPEEFGPALRQALGAQRPVLLEVPIPTQTPPFQVVR